MQHDTHNNRDNSALHGRNYGENRIRPIYTYTYDTRAYLHKFLVYIVINASFGKRVACLPVALVHSVHSVGPQFHLFYMAFYINFREEFMQ